MECISILKNENVEDNKTLIFLDEIQECPNAIKSLRYFYENRPKLHIIGAGSLLDFTITEKDFKIPVGRIQYLYMKPFSFLEFLHAIGKNILRDFIENLNINKEINQSIHNELLLLIKKYSIIGGMPAVLNEYINSGNLINCHKIQSLIIQTYKDDFRKYANKVQYKYLQKVFYASAKMVGKKFKYSKVDRNIQSRELRNAVELLEKAGVIYCVKRSGNFPLEYYVNDKYFKTIFLDIGLMQNICGVTEDILIEDNLQNIYSGAVAEQLVGQELITYEENYKNTQLFYWSREKKNSSAEVDYLIQIGSKAYPIEVKSGKTGRLKSILMYIKKFSIPYGIKISQQEKTIQKPIISIPFYLIKRIKNYIKLTKLN